MLTLSLYCGVSRLLSFSPLFLVSITDIVNTPRLASARKQRPLALTCLSCYIIAFMESCFV